MLPILSMADLDLLVARIPPLPNKWESLSEVAHMRVLMFLAVVLVSRFYVSHGVLVSRFYVSHVVLVSRCYVSHVGCCVD
jgi:hypothetical protein